MGGSISEKFVFKQSCCGCTLRTGSLLVGWLQVVGGVASFAGLIYLIAALRPEAVSEDCYTDVTTPVPTSTVITEVELLENNEFEVKLRRLIGLAHIELINIVISFVVGLLALIGVYKPNYKVFWAAVYIETILVFWNLAFLISYGFSLLWQEEIVGLINFAIYLYFVIVLRSYGYEVKKAKKLKDESEESLTSSSAEEPEAIA